MNQKRIRQAEQQRGLLLSFLLAIAMALGLDTQGVLGQEPGVPHGRANSSRALTTVASQESEARPPWQIRALLVIVGLACWHLTQRLLGERAGPPKCQAEQVGQFLGEQDTLLRLSQPVNRFLNAHPRWANALLIVS